MKSFIGSVFNSLDTRLVVLPGLSNLQKGIGCVDMFLRFLY